MTRRIELADLPERFRAQAAAQLQVKHESGAPKEIFDQVKRTWGRSRPGLPHHTQLEMAIRTEKRGMNKLEAAYSCYLEALVHSKNVIRWRFEPLKLRIGRSAYYKPDFMVVVGSFGHEKIELHETKGFWREAARVRIKVAADLFPEFTFIAIQRKGGFWTEERF